MREQLYNLTCRSETLATLRRAQTAPQRMRGLLGKDTLPAGWGIWLQPCGAVHTLFMKFELDLLFLDKNQVVLEIRRNLPPWRLAFGPRRTASVIELESGWLKPKKINLGDKLVLTQIQQPVPRATNPISS